MSPRRAAPAATRANAKAHAHANANADQATNVRKGPKAYDAISLGTTLSGTMEFTSTLDDIDGQATTAGLLAQGLGVMQGVGVRSCIAILQNKT